jgi:hypothetical protein
MDLTERVRRLAIRYDAKANGNSPDVVDTALKIAYREFSDQLAAMVEMRAKGEDDG